MNHLSGKKDKLQLACNPYTLKHAI